MGLQLLTQNIPSIVPFRVVVGPECPSTEDQINDTWDICATEYYSAMKKDERTPLVVTSMNLQIATLGEVSQTEEEKHHTISLTCTV